MRLYYNNIAYLLAERKIEEKLKELLVLQSRDKLDRNSMIRLEKIINRRERDRRERERERGIKKQDKMTIKLNEEEYNFEEEDYDFEDKKRILEEEMLKRSLENDDEIFLQLEDIYRKQEKNMGYDNSKYRKK